MTIKKVLTSGRVPVKIWTEDIEPEAEQQLINLSTLPFVFKHVSVMPDVHLGAGACIGTVLATKGAIILSSIGSDIGCGMAAIKTNLFGNQVREKIKELRHSIERSIPTGFNAHKSERAPGLDWQGFLSFEQLTIPTRVLNDKQKYKNQLGTLGGGNHFIEICLDTDNRVWVMLHSGSRNIGKTLADIHLKKAQELMKQFFIELPDKELAFLPQGTNEFDNFLYDVQWAQSYAMENRRLMLELVMKDLSYTFNNGQPLSRLLEVNCHHNYVELENHYGTNVYITRKGAIRARSNDLGIIPGSMGTRSYIVQGKGEMESYCSSSHGAGRRMSRTKARNTFKEEDILSQTEGVECKKDNSILDELPGAYKSIESVMANQEDLVTVLYELKQLLCIKG